MKKISLLVTVMILISLGILLFSCKPKDDQWADPPSTTIMIDDRDIVKILFGADALYPYDGFGNNIYLLSYSIANYQINDYDLYDPNIEDIYISDENNNIADEIIFQCIRIEYNENHELYPEGTEFPKTTTNGDTIITTNKATYNDIVDVYISTFSNSNGASAIFIYNNHSYLISFNNLYEEIIDLNTSEVFLFIKGLFIGNGI